MARNLQSKTVTIASGTTSASIPMGVNRVPLAIVTPASIASSTISFQASYDGSSFVALYYEGTLYNPAVAASRHIALDRRAFEGVKQLVLVMGSSETAKTFTIITGE
jgi:hypothetical protein